ncbi:DUF2237 domain-containing protein [Guyparkeria sp. GHLCS8-2]|uniref:DUF2237 family protein n=1 Tax=Guyparkeria halopsychrophila TaxID=3139421 RepID=UPI0037C5EB99
MKTDALNVLGLPLARCSVDPITGFYRDGRCLVGTEDGGVHGVCTELDDAFLGYTAGQGNELRRPIPAYDFPGLRAGDRWCVCAWRWREAFEAGVAPPVVLASTHHEVLRVIKLRDLIEHAVDPPASGLDDGFYEF